MRKIIVFVLAVFISVSSAYAETIQIGSFNIKYLGDGINDQNPREDFDLKKLAQIIDLLDIELLAVIEVENKAALDKLVEKLPKDGQGNAIYDSKIGQSGDEQSSVLKFLKNCRSGIES